MLSTLRPMQCDTGSTFGATTSNKPARCGKPTYLPAATWFATRSMPGRAARKARRSGHRLQSVKIGSTAKTKTDTPAESGARGPTGPSRVNKTTHAVPRAAIVGMAMIHDPKKIRLNAVEFQQMTPWVLAMGISAGRGEPAIGAWCRRVSPRAWPRPAATPSLVENPHAHTHKRVRTGRQTL